MYQAPLFSCEVVARRAGGFMGRFNGTGPATGSYPGFTPISASVLATAIPWESMTEKCVVFSPSGERGISVARSSLRVAR